MSWSATFECSVGSIRAAANATTPSMTEGYAEPEQAHAYRQSIESAITVAEAVGSQDAMVRVSVSGHANEGLVQTGGWARDFVTIRVERL